MNQKGISGQMAAWKNSKYFLPGLASLAAVVVIGGAAMLHNNLQYSPSSASCYGYGCQSSVTIGARVQGYGYSSPPFSYGTLTITAGQMIELTWNAQNVDRCYATEKWTGFQGLYYPPTLFPNPIQQSRTFGVTCLKANRVVATSTININVINIKQAVVVSLDASTPVSREYPGSGQTAVPFATYKVTSTVNTTIVLNGIKVNVDSNILPSYLSNIQVIANGGPVQTAVKKIEKGYAISLSNVTLKPNTSVSLLIRADVAAGARGTLRFVLSEVTNNQKITITGVPVTANYMTFTAFDCIKAPCPGGGSPGSPGSSGVNIIPKKGR